MQAKDVMTTNVTTVKADTPVEAVAKLLLERKISGAPVVEDTGRVVGMVSEGDLIRRPENDAERRPSWWLKLIGGSDALADEYIKTRGLRAAQVMTKPVLSIGPDTPLGDIAELLERRRIKRVPVLHDDKLIGIVSRANLLQGLAARNARPAPPATQSDQALRAQVLTALGELNWLSHGTPNVIVSDGVVQLWGWVESEREREAVQLAVERVPGVGGVENHIASYPHYVYTT